MIYRSIIVAVVVQASVFAAETRLVVESDQPMSVSLDSAQRDTMQTSHEFIWRSLPDNVFMQPTITGRNQRGQEVSRVVTVTAGEDKRICLSFPAPQPVVVPPDPVHVDCDCHHDAAASSVCDLRDLYWLLLGGLIGGGVLYSFWKWRCCQMWQRELDQATPQSRLRSSGGGSNIT